MSANQALYPIARMCRLLGVSTSGYHAWRRRPPSARARRDEVLLKRIGEIHAASKGTYGAPRIHAELAAEGISVGRKRVARLMRVAGLRGISRRKAPRTTWRDERQRPAADLVQRNFSAQGPDRLWVADITYVATWAGFLYLAVVLDVFSRRIVGWAMAPITCARLWSWMPSIWRSSNAAPRPSSTIPTGDRSTPPSSSASAAARPASGPPWARPVIAMTMPCARASSRPWSASCSTVSVSDLMPRPRERSSNLSRDGTILAEGTPPSATYHQSNLRGEPYPPLAKVRNRPRNRANFRRREDPRCGDRS